MEEEEHGQTCSACGRIKEAGELATFATAPVCDRCRDMLGLESIGPGEPDPRLERLIDPEQRDVLVRTAGLIRTLPKDMGWKLIGMAPHIKGQIDDPAKAEILSSGVLLIGSALVMDGNDEVPLEMVNETVSLLIVLGQFLDLSLMRRISRERGLRENNALDEMILVGEHFKIVFDLLQGLEHHGEPDKEMMLANGLSGLL